MSRVQGLHKERISALQERAKANVSFFADFFFRNRGGGFGALCPAGGPSLGNWQPSLMEDKKPKLTQFNAFNVGPSWYRLLKSTHGETITGHAYDRAKIYFGQNSRKLLLREKIVDQAMMPDLNDNGENYKGHCYNPHMKSSGKDPGDALSRIRACAEAFELAAQSPEKVRLALGKLKQGPLVNIANEIEHEINGTKLRPRAPKALKPTGFILSLVYNVEQMEKQFGDGLDSLLSKLSGRKPPAPEAQQAIALSRILGQLVHYSQDLECIVHTAAHKNADGTWEMELLAEHAELEYTLSFEDAKKHIGIRQNRSPEAFFEIGIAAKKPNWIGELLFVCENEAIVSRSKMDEFVKTIGEGKEPISRASMANMVNNAVDLSSYIIIACAKICENA